MGENYFQVKSGWEIKRIKDLLPQYLNGVWGDYSEDGTGIPVLRSTEQNVEGVLNIVDPAILSIKKVGKNNKLKNKDLLLTKSSGSKEHIGKCSYITSENGEGYCFSNFMMGIRFNNHIHSKFIQYCINSSLIKKQINNNSINITLNNLTNEGVGKLFVPVPPREQQTVIVSYLDQETSKIDRKILILEKKFEKIEEYKQSVIFETVTKGLHSNVPMKDSGIEWIGEIPKHWEILRLKEFYKLGMGQTILKEDLIDDGKYPIYSATAEDKFFGYVDKINNPLNVGDLVIPARGNSIGHVKLVKETVACTQTTIYMKKRKNINSNYVYYYLIGNKPQLFFFDDTAIPQITVEQINGRLVLIPSSQEQEQIASYLNDICSKIDKKKEIIKKKIKLLKEYKQTIIYEAVTGKVEIN